MALRIVEALDAYMREYHGGSVEDCRKAFEELKRARADTTFASDEEIERARDQYALGSDDDIEVDDGALSSQADGGTWVQAWVWLPDEA
jgi:hypothetical protein